ncbi:MAG: fumarylacetoacetate hydrolase family protein [Deltaproteobacteria bacterium]|nr:fumarylacetoacetate hydrolase family protein [Deltaproteobacteria bacterium]
MRLIRYRHGNRISYGLFKGEDVFCLAGDVFGEFREGQRVAPLDGVTLLSPVPPSKIVAVGLNYRDHAEEVGARIPEEPLIFLKPSTAVIGPGEPIIYPPMSSQVDYEGELGVVVRRRAARISPDEAGNFILGYTCINDVTARDLQKKDRQWTRAKGFDTFAPLGPWIETDLDPRSLKLETFLNGELKQSSNTANLIFDCHQLVSFVSHVMTLMPGDVIATGTPSGIGPMSVGDRVDVVIEGIGTLTNTVTKQHDTPTG